MSAGHRLPKGGLVDRAQPLSFTFDGRVLSGLAGDTLASALIANGIGLVGRSFKYHRPRGILTAGTEEPNALVELRSGARLEPNTKATTVELYDGLDARSQNRWPSLRFDAMAINSLFSPFLVAGFYYKTFMWPAALWEKFYEPAIRRAAGLGRASNEPDPDCYEKAWAHCDVLVAGAGPAGLSAALAAARTGARVILCEEDRLLGGRLLSDGGEIDGAPAVKWLSQVEAELKAAPNVRIFRRSSVFGVFDGGTFGVLERVNDHISVPPEHEPRQRLWRVVAKRMVVAAGANERPLVFPDNDRPGVMLASAMRTYLNRFAVAPGRRLALFTNNDDGWRTAEAARDAGLDVAAVVDSRPELPPRLAELGSRLGIPVHSGMVEKLSSGGDGISAIHLRATNGKTSRVEVDTLAMSGGWNPSVGLTSQHRGRPVWNDHVIAFAPGELPPEVSVAGAAAGKFGLGMSLRDGHAAGIAAARDCGKSGAAGEPAAAPDLPYSINPLWHVDGRRKAFVDFQNDVTVKDVEIAHREGFRSVEHLKRYTTLGMATDQGRTSSVNGLAIMAGLSGQTIPEAGTTIYRAPLNPVAIAAFAGTSRGRSFRPTRLTPSHHWAAERRAVFVDAGQWKRAQWYPQPGEKDWLESVRREVSAVREGVGFCDVSTLGKIDVMGPGAGIFLDRVYINTFSTLAVGKVRYGLMLREDGIAYDDGTTARLAEDHYLMTTTTAKAGPVMQHLEYCRQVLWPELDVQLTSATDQWAQFSVAGPWSRALLQNLADSSEDLSNEGFPFMGVRNIRLRGGQTARLFRISFSGELAFEIAVPAHLGDCMARNLMAAGDEFGVVPYGTEALGTMRIEKGHVAGPELNGTTTAADLGLGKMASKKMDYIGRALAGRSALVASDRQVVVGVKPVAPDAQLRSGAHIVPRGSNSGPDADQGYVTSVCFSPVLEQWIGLALVSHGRERYGEIVRAYDPLREGDIEVEICNPVFYDPEGARQRG